MRRISLLSFFAVFISVSLFLIVLFVMNGMNKNIQNRIVQLDPNITVVLNQIQNFNDDDLANVTKAQMLKYNSFDLIVRTVDGQFRGTHAVGYSKDHFRYWLSRLSQIKKRDSSDYEFQSDLQKNEIAVGVDIARMLGLLEGDQVTLIPIETLLLGQTERPLFEKVIVKKIISSDLPEIDGGTIFFNSDNTLQNFRNSPSQQKGYHIWLDNMSQLSTHVDVLKQKKFKTVETWKDKNSNLFFALMMEKTMIGLILGLAGLIASTSILTVLVLIMSQKKTDIAIIKTVGFSDLKTLKLFTQIGLWISFSAIILGTLFGLSISYYLQYYPLQVLPQIYLDSSIPALVDLRFAGLVFIISSVLAILGCYIPARATLNIQPAILLKQKN